MEDNSKPANISLKESTINKLDDEARRDVRTRSNMAEVLILEALEARKLKNVKK